MKVNKFPADMDRRSSPFAPSIVIERDMHTLINENHLLRASLAEARARIIELEALADSDTLTPLPNRRRFLRELDLIIQEFKGKPGRAALLFVDVDRLKVINDTHGHGAGDAALQHVARLLLSQIRGTDLVARLGGDEFGIILSHATTDDARDKAVALSSLIEATPLLLDGQAVPITISVGCSAIDEASDAQSALARADGEMYASKLFSHAPTDNSGRSA